MPISQNLNHSFLSYPEKRQGDNAIITFEETRVFEIENTSFLSIIIIIIIIFIEGAQLAKAVFSGALMHKSN